MTSLNIQGVSSMCFVGHIGLTKNLDGKIMTEIKTFFSLRKIINDQDSRDLSPFSIEIYEASEECCNVYSMEVIPTSHWTNILQFSSFCELDFYRWDVKPNSIDGQIHKMERMT